MPQGPTGYVKKKAGGRETSVNGEPAPVGGQRLSTDLEISAGYIIKWSKAKAEPIINESRKNI